MTWVDRRLQSWRIAQARPFIKPGARVLDLGSADGALFQQLVGISSESLGIDPTLKTNVRVQGVLLVSGKFPNDMPDVEPFDVITMLAVLEHFPDDAYAGLSENCAKFLKPNGRVVITVPSAVVDHILAVLKFFRLIDGMSIEEHHGYDTKRTETIFYPRFKFVRHHRFQLGLNNLFVFEKV